MSKIIVRRQEYANNGTHANEIEAVVKQNLIANTLSGATDIAPSVGLLKSINDKFDTVRWVYNPFEIVNSSVVSSLDDGDCYLVICGRLVYISVRFIMASTTTGSVSAMKLKDEFLDYVPVNYNKANGVILPCQQTWNNATMGMLYINSHWGIGLSGGLTSGGSYIAQGTYLI